MNDKTDQPQPTVGDDSAAKDAEFNWKKWVTVGTLALVAIALAIGLLWPSSVQVEVARVQFGPVTVTVEDQGRTRAKYRYTVGAPISGRLLRTEFVDGDRVERGDVLARITPPPTDARTEATARAEVAAAVAREREASAALAEASTSYRLAKTQAARRESLYRDRLVSAEDRDAYAQAEEAAEAKLRSAEASVLAAEADVASARARLLGASTKSDTEGAIDIRAPVSGRVLRVYEESQRVVQSGTPLFDLSRGDALELRIDVLSEEAVKVRAGDPIRITGWGGGETLMGKVRYVEPGAFTKISALGVEEQRVNVIGDLPDAPPALGAEFRVEAAIVTWSGDVLRIPTGAMFRRDGVWQVFAIDGGKARLRKLDVGHRGNDFAEVKAGLKEGDTVIVYPSDQIENDTRVEGSS